MCVIVILLCLGSKSVVTHCPLVVGPPCCAVLTVTCLSLGMPSRCPIGNEKCGAVSARLGCVCAAAPGRYLHSWVENDFINCLIYERRPSSRASSRQGLAGRLSRSAGMLQ